MTSHKHNGGLWRRNGSFNGSQMANGHMGGWERVERMREWDANEEEEGVVSCFTVLV